MRSRRLPPGDQKRPGAVSFETYLVGSGGYPLGLGSGYAAGFLLRANRFLKSLRPMACVLSLSSLDDLKFGIFGFLSRFFFLLFFSLKGAQQDTEAHFMVPSPIWNSALRPKAGVLPSCESALTQMDAEMTGSGRSHWALPWFVALLTL